MIEMRLQYSVCANYKLFTWLWWLTPQRHAHLNHIACSIADKIVWVLHPNLNCIYEAAMQRW